MHAAMWQSRILFPVIHRSFITSPAQHAREIHPGHSPPTCTGNALADPDGRGRPRRAPIPATFGAAARRMKLARVVTRRAKSPRHQPAIPRIQPPQEARHAHATSPVRFGCTCTIALLAINPPLFKQIRPVVVSKSSNVMCPAHCSPLEHLHH